MFSNSLKYKKDSIKYFPVLFFTFFPYLTFYSFGSDIQPLSIIMVTLFIIILISNKYKFNIFYMFLLLPLFYAIFLFILSADYFSGVRSLIGYMTISLVPIVFYFILNNKFDLFVTWLKVTTIVYFFVGLIQILINDKFMLPLLNRISSDETRGVTSLAPEPTFYGIICLFLILIFINLNIKYKKKYIYLLLFQIIFLSQSSMVILFLIIFLCLYLLLKINIKIMFFGIFGITILYLVIYNVDFLSYNIRFIHLINKFLEEPSTIFIVDASINDRVSAIYFSLKGFFDNYMLANGFGTFSTYLNTELPKQEIFWWVSVSNRIMSYYGSILYELGFIGLIIPIVYSALIIKAFKYYTRNLLLYLLFVNIILFTAIPLSFPLVGIYMATLLYKAKCETLNNP